MSLCRAMVRDLEAAEDLTQEVFGRAFIGLRSFHGEASTRSWLLTIARNRCIDHLRRQSRESQAARLEDSAPDHRLDDSPLPADLVARRHQVKNALNALGEIERALVVLHFRHGLDHEELTEVFGLRDGTVGARLSRAVARIRATLEQPAEEPASAARRLEPLDTEEELDEDTNEREEITGRVVEDIDEKETPRPTPVESGRWPLVRRAVETPPPAPAPDHPLGQALAALDPGLPIGLVERLLERTSQL